MQVLTPNATVGELLDFWLLDAALDLKESTIAQYALDVRRHLLVDDRDVLVRDITSSRVYAWLRTKSTEGLAARTVGRLRNELHRAFRLAEVHGVIDRNPVTAVRGPRRLPGEARVLTPVEVQALLRACAGEWIEAIVVTAVVTGARKGELFALRWSDLDLEAGSIAVRRTAREFSGQGVRLLAPKSARSRRLIKIGPETAGMLRVHRERLAAVASRVPTWVDHDLVFPTRSGTIHSAGSFRRSYRRILCRAGIQGASFHTLRHTAASFMIREGVPLSAVAAQLGHATPAITHAVYAHVLPGMQEEAVSRIERALSAGTR